MSARGTASWERDLIRRFPRVEFISRVQVPVGDEVFTARSRNISLGGMMLESDCDFPPGTELRVCFELSPGRPMNPRARVIHCRPGVRFGVEFTDLEEYELKALQDFIQVDESHRRRSIRLPERLFVNLYWTEGGRVSDSPAETILLSKHGCLLLSRKAPPMNSPLTLWWTEKKAGTDAHIVWRREGLDGWVTAALEFGADTNFWGIDFEPEKP